MMSDENIIYNKTKITHYALSITDGKCITTITQPGQGVDKTVYPEVAQYLIEHNLAWINKEEVKDEYLPGQD